MTWDEYVAYLERRVEALEDDLYEARVKLAEATADRKLFDLDEVDFVKPEGGA